MPQVTHCSGRDDERKEEEPNHNWHRNFTLEGDVREDGEVLEIIVPVLASLPEPFLVPKVDYASCEHGGVVDEEPQRFTILGLMERSLLWGQVGGLRTHTWGQRLWLVLCLNRFSINGFDVEGST